MTPSLTVRRVLLGARCGPRRRLHLAPVGAGGHPRLHHHPVRAHAAAGMQGPNHGGPFGFHARRAKSTGSCRDWLGRHRADERDVEHLRERAPVPFLVDPQVLEPKLGFQPISQSQTYTARTTLTPKQQHAESYGTLPAFESHGFNRAWGLFTYPGSKWTTEIQTNVISTYFAYGRAYGARTNNRSRVVARWIVRALSTHGGPCNDSINPCFNIVSLNRYHSPDYVASLMQVSTDQWSILQFYRFVTARTCLATSNGIAPAGLAPALDQQAGRLLLERFPHGAGSRPGECGRDRSRVRCGGPGTDPIGCRP
jgi:hypothetical protein